ncbi:hypothetical protein ABIB38_001402 [Massilia sp. UYP11]
MHVNFPVFQNMSWTRGSRLRSASGGASLNVSSTAGRVPSPGRCSIASNGGNPYLTRKALMSSSLVPASTFPITKSAMAVPFTP